MNPDIIGCVWTGEFDLNTLRVDAAIFEFGMEKLRIQKYPVTCGRSLIKIMFFLFAHCLTFLLFGSSYFIQPFYQPLCFINILIFSLFSFSCSLGWHSKRETNVPSRTTEAEFAIPWTFILRIYFIFISLLFSFSQFSKIPFHYWEEISNFYPTMIFPNCPRWVNCEGSLY